MKNSKHWNRILTGAAAVSLAIGTMAPMAFAASASTQYNTRTMNVGNGFTAVVQGLVAQDQGHATEFLPIYYLMQGLGKLGYTVNWNGGTRTLNITTPAGVTVTAPTGSVGAPGANQMVIQLNGTSVMTAPRVVAKDPASGVMTTFAPIYYLNQALKLAGFTNTYNGQSWTLSGQAASQTGTLGSVTVSNASSGTGSATSPAVSLNNTAISLAITLKDASGNPLPNTAVTYNVSEYGNYPTGNLPTVENASGTVISGTQQTSAEQYTVYTDANGNAKVSLTGPSGTTYSYEVVATAPYAGANGGAISSAPAYLEFVTNNEVGVSPYASSTADAYSESLNTPVPITVTLPPNAQGQAQANVLLTLTTNGHASFVTSTGAVQGQTIQVATDSSGIAQAYLSDPVQETVSVSVSNLPTGINVNQSNQTTYISFGQTGVPAKFNNFSISGTSVNIGQNVFVSGQLEDATGNPVANGQILITASNNNKGNAFSYVSGTTTTAFPVLGTSYNTLSTGTPATSAYGDVVTADSAGNFSFSLNDSRSYTEPYAVYGVANGEVANPISVPTGDAAITFAQSTTLQTLSIGALDGYVQGNSSTSVTGLTAQADAGGITLGGVSADNGNNSQLVDVYVEPQNAAGHHGGALNQSLVYNLTVSNGGEIYSINGVSITPAAAVTLQYTPGTGYQVNGSTTVIPSLSSTNALSVSGGAQGALPEDFEVGVINANTGATTMTVTSGGVSSTASMTYSGGTPDQVASFTPAMATVSAGQSQTVQFQVQDTNGNPVPNVATTVQTDQNAGDPFWITQINGATLQETLNMGTAQYNSFATEATPIPLGQTPSALNYNVSVPGVVMWNANSNDIQVYSNASGNVTFTLQAGGLSYPTQYSSSLAANPANSVPAVGTSSGANLVRFYTDTNGDNGSVPLYIGMSQPTGITNAASFTIQGAIGWTGSGLGTTTTPTGTGTGTTTPNPDFTTLPTVTAPVMTVSTVTGTVASNVVSVNIVDSTSGNSTPATPAQLASGVPLINTTVGDTIVVTPVLSSGADTVNAVTLKA